MLSGNTAYYPRLYREDIQIYKYNSNLIRKEEGMFINKSGYPVLKSTKVKLFNNSGDIGENGMDIEAFLDPPCCK